MSKVRVALIGVGNCASALVQGVAHYRNASADEFVPGLMHAQLGPYHIRDIEFSAAIDVDRSKVGKDLSEAIFTEPNNTPKFSDVDQLGVTVSRGMTHDGIGRTKSGKLVPLSVSPPPAPRPRYALPPVLCLFVLETLAPADADTGHTIMIKI